MIKKIMSIVSDNYYCNMATHVFLTLQSFNSFSFDTIVDWDVLFIRPEFLYLLGSKIQDIHSRFILITGSDFAIPEDHRLGQSLFETLLQCKYLMKWYTINLVNTKGIYKDVFVQLPIGIPFFSPVRRNGWMEWNYSPERIMTNIPFRLLEWDKFQQENKTHPKLVYISYSSVNTSDGVVIEGQLQYKHRDEIDKHLATSSLQKLNLVDFDDYIHEARQYKMMLCPMGRGFDTFRVWEALTLGIVPIVFSNPANAIYQGLPVITITRLEQLNEDYLLAQWNELMHSDHSFSFETLKIDYWQKHLQLPHYSLQHSIGYSLEEKSTLTPELLAMHGMSGKMFRHFLNRMGSFPHMSYLEVGTHTGSTVNAFMKHNRNKVTVIDMWKEDKVYETFKNTSASHIGDNELSIIKSNCWDVDPYSIGTFRIFFYDGDHSYRSQYRALIHFYPCMEKRFVFVIDDWNLLDVRKGTFDSIRDLNYKVIYQFEQRTTNNDDYAPMHLSFQYGDWHNGVGILLVEKHT